METFFLRTLETCYRLSISLEFIVCPDVVGNGALSLRFSERWAAGRLLGCPCLALAVQDGMTPKIIRETLADYNFRYIFVGGTLDWKWKTTRDWVEFAHDLKLKCHVGRVGSIEKLDYCRSIGADSVDSSSFVRNGTWYKCLPKQTLFTEP